MAILEPIKSPIPPLFPSQLWIKAEPTFAGLLEHGSHTLFCHALWNKSSIHNLSTTHAREVVITLCMHKNQAMNLNDLLKATKQVGG